MAAFNEKFQVDLLFLDDIIALDVMDVSSEYLPPNPRSREEPPEGLGRLLQLLDWSFRPSNERPGG